MHLRIALALLAALLAGAVPAAQPALEITVHARELVPGEPIRVVVRSGEPLRSASGRFLDRDVAMAPVPGQDQPFVWAGWSMIGLEQSPGEASLEIQAVASSGEHRVATRAVTVKPKSFPEENLKVSSKYVEPPREVADRLARERAKLKKMYARRGPFPLAAPFVRPVPGEPTSIFGTRRLFNGKPRSAHPGLDLRAATGTPVAASGDGLVVLAEDLYYSGNIVILDHGGGLFTLYAHLSRIDVAEGDQVRAGQQIGQSGATGRVTGPHLHWGAKIGNEPFDPTALLDPSLYGD